MKYKIGDKVTVRDDLIVNTQYGVEVFVPAMIKLVGGICEIEQVYKGGNHYKLKGSTYVWTSEMVEPYSDYNPIQNILDIVNMLNNTTLEIGDEFSIENEANRYRFTKERLEFTNENGISGEVGFTLLGAITIGWLTVTPLTWKPKLHEGYFCLMMSSKCGYHLYYNSQSDIDKRLFKHGIIAKTTDEIIKLRNEQDWWTND